MSDTSFGQGKKKETVYSGPPIQGTVYDPSRHAGTSSRRASRVTSPEEMQKYGNVFFGVALVSLYNTVTTIFGSKTFIVLGLGFTQAFDNSIRRGGPIAPVVIINVIVAAVFAVLAIFARGGSGAAYLIGILLYGADTLLLWLDNAAAHTKSLIFHGVVLVVMCMGFAATRGRR